VLDKHISIFFATAAVVAAAAAAAAAAVIFPQVDCDVGRPKVNYRETIQRRAEFDYLHKKQSGGSGGRVNGQPGARVTTSSSPASKQYSTHTQ